MKNKALQSFIFKWKDKFPQCKNTITFGENVMGKKLQEMIDIRASENSISFSALKAL